MPRHFHQIYIFDIFTKYTYLTFSPIFPHPGRDLLDALNTSCLPAEESTSKRKDLCNRVCFLCYISRPHIKATAPLQTSSPLGRDKDDKGLVQLKSIIMSSAFKHFSQEMLLSFRKQNKEEKVERDNWDSWACLFWFIPWPKRSQAYCFGAAAPWVCGWVNPVLVWEQTWRTWLLLHFACFVKSLQTPNCCCCGEFGSQSGGDPLRDLQDHLWPTGSWSKSSWTSVLMKDLEEIAVCSSFADLLFIFVMLEGRCKGFSLSFHDCFVTWDFLWYMIHTKV